MITVDGVNNTLNFLNINDISNINNYTLPISLFPRSSSLYSNIMSHGDIIDFKMLNDDCELECKTIQDVQIGDYIKLEVIL